MPFPEIASKRKSQWSLEPDLSNPWLKISVDTAGTKKKFLKNPSSILTNIQSLHKSTGISKWELMKIQGNRGNRKCWSITSTTFPSQEIRGCTAIETKNISQRFIIHTNMGAGYSVCPAPHQNAGVACGTLIDAGYRDALVFNCITVYPFRPAKPARYCRVCTCKEANSFLCPLLIIS